MQLLETALHELLRSHQHGYHLLIITREAVDFFLQELELNPLQVYLLRKIREDYTQNGSMFLSASCYCELVIADKITKFGPSFLVPFSAITPELVGQPTKLIVEDQASDGFVLDYALKQIKDKIGLPRFRVSCVHGGGASITKVFGSTCADGSIAVAISDSDMNAPVGQVTKQYAKLIASKSKGKIAEAFVLPCREIENIITIDAMEALQCSTGCGWVSHARTIESNDGNSSFWLFLDLKNGLDDKRLAAMDALSKAWVEERLLSCGVNTKSFSISGFGSSIVSQLAASGAALSTLRVGIRSSKWIGIFGELFSQIAWWFVSSEGVRA